MSLVLQSSGGGSVTLEEPVTASNFTITVPATTATMAINGPAFSAWNSSAQTLGTNTVTKVLFDTEEFDTNNNFASSRFTPTVAGYYQINSTVSWPTPTWGDGYIYKNGIVYKQFFYSFSSSVSASAGSVLVYLNGSTDYVEIYLRIGIGQTLVATAVGNWVQGSLVRAA